MNEQLPAFVLAELFNKSLVITGNEPELKPVKEAIAQSKNFYLGNYGKKIVILVNDKDNVYLSDESLEFLTGILHACKLNLAHIALINLDKYGTNFQQLKKELQPQFLLSFGVKALEIELPFTMPDYQVQQYSNCSIVTAPALTELNSQSPEAKAEKTKLWRSLKKMLDL